MSGMNEQGKYLFLAGHPAFEPDVSEICDGGSGDDEYVTDGCYDPFSGTIYLRSTSDEIKPMNVVTAGHETLHASYAKMDPKTRSKVERAVEAEVRRINDAELNERLAHYEKIDPGSRSREAFAILGSEFETTSPILESAYGKVFGSRSKILTAQSASKRAHDEAQVNINRLHADIDQADNDAQAYLTLSYLAQRQGKDADKAYYVGLRQQALERSKALQAELDTKSSEYRKTL